MKLRRLILKNFCQHARRDITFTSGLNGIVGHNGAGKSNILEAIKFAISGQLPRKVEEYIRIGADDVSSVDLYFTDETGTKDYHILRRLSAPRDARLDTPDGSIRGHKSIAPYLYEDFGIDFDVLKTIQIVPQENWVSLFRATPSERAVMYRRMFGCEVLEQKRVALNDFVKSISAPAGLGESIKMLKEMLKEKRKQLEAYKDLPDIQHASQEMEAIKRSKAELEKQFRSIEYCDGIKRELAKIDKYLSDNAGADLDAEYDVDSVNSKLDKLRYALISLNQSIKQIEYVKANNVPQIKAIVNNIIEAYSTIELLAPKYEPNVSVEICDAHIFDIDNRLEPLKQANNECPTCGKSLSEEELEGLIDKYTAEREEWSNLKSKLRADGEVFWNNVGAISGLWNHKLKPLLIQWNGDNYIHDKNLLNILGMIKEVETPIRFANATQEILNPSMMLKQVEEMEKALDNYLSDVQHVKEQYTAEEEQATKEYEETKAKYEAHIQLKTNINTAKEKKDEYLLYLEKFDTNDGLTAADVKGRLALMEVSIQKQFGILNQINKADTLKADIDNLQQRLDSLNVRRAMDQQLLDRKSVLSGVVSMLSPDRFPRYVISTWLRTIEASINNYLAAFGAEFRAEVQDNTDILCKFNDGKKLDATTLSGGQQVVLAIAWRLALHYTFSHSEACGFLTLDEPTTFLDTDNIDNLVTVMNNIKTIAENNSLQIIVITHSESLLPLFDNVIQL